MKLSDYNFELPTDLIAQQPLTEREGSRMLIVDRSSTSFHDSAFRSLPDHLKRGDLIVINNTKVIPARLAGRTETGSNIEIFLVEESEPLLWTVLARPGKRLKPGKLIRFDSEMSAEVIEKRSDGKVTVRFRPGERLFDEVIHEIGRTPLPPYIRRERGKPDEDRDRYQTVFAQKRGAIAAPTAGLHFSPGIFDEIRSKGVEIAEITLHVGYGTFEPVRSDEISAHTVAGERFEISDIAADQLEKARKDGRRIIAVGTTTTRTLEFAISHLGEFRPATGIADLTIRPGYRFRAINGLLTNFHLPESSLLILVATFGGHELIMDSYRHAVSERYRFYSYGDCMLIV